MTFGWSVGLPCCVVRHGRLLQAVGEQSESVRSSPPFGLRVGLILIVVPRSFRQVHAE